LIGEEYFKEIEEPNDGRMTTTNFTEIFHYVNISVYWFDSIGMIKGVYIIPKNQISINDQGVYSSYTLAKNKKDLFFFYNDNPKNLSGQNPTADNPKPISGFRKIYLKSVQINNKGVTKNKIVFSSSRKAHIRPKKGSQMPDGITYFLVQKNRKNALLTIEFH